MAKETLKQRNRLMRSVLLLPFRIETMNFSFRLSNSCVRFRDSSAESFARGGRSILISLMSFNLLAIINSVPNANHYFTCMVAQSERFTSAGLAPGQPVAAQTLVEPYESRSP